MRRDYQRTVSGSSPPGSQLLQDGSPGLAQNLRMSPSARIMLGVSLIVVPTIIYGGLTVLGIVSGGAYGTPAPAGLSPLQQTFYRAGHAHAGVLLMLSLILQLVIDAASLGGLEWPARIAAPGAAVLVSAGFFMVAHAPALRFVLYAGALLVAATTLVVGIGLLVAP